MESLGGVLVFLLRKVIPTRSSLRRLARAALNNPVRTAVIYLMAFVLMYFMTWLLAKFAVRDLTPPKYVLRSDYLIILPDHYEDAAYTLKQRSTAIPTYARRAFAAALPEILKAHPERQPALRMLPSTDGLFTLQLVDARPWIERSSSTLAADTATFQGLLDSVAPSVLLLMPQGSRVEKLYEEAGQLHGTTRPVPAILPLFAGLVFGFLVVAANVAAWARSILEPFLAKKLFPETRRILEIARYRNMTDRLREFQPPNELLLIYEFIVSEYQRGKRSFALTSAFSGEGKSTMSLFLARMLSGNYPVHLYDADLRQDITRAMQDLSRTGPWSNVVVNLHTLELRTSGRARLIDQVKGLRASAPADAIHLFDCTPAFAASEELSLLRQMDCVILVLQERQYPWSVEETREKLDFCGITPTLIAINKVITKHEPYGPYDAAVPQQPQKKLDTRWS